MAAERHSRRANYVFVDGHAEMLESAALYDPAEGVDRWTPAKAR